MADPIIAFRGTAPGPDEPGKFHQGLPACSLSGADYDALDTDQRALVRASALYDYAGWKAAMDKSKDAGEDTVPTETTEETPPAAGDATPSPG